MTGMNPTSSWALVLLVLGAVTYLSWAIYARESEDAQQRDIAACDTAPEDRSDTPLTSHDDHPADTAALHLSRTSRKQTS